MRTFILCCDFHKGNTDVFSRKISLAVDTISSFLQLIVGVCVLCSVTLSTIVKGHRLISSQRTELTRLFFSDDGSEASFRNALCLT
jgi:hypothetical protein